MEEGKQASKSFSVPSIVTSVILSAAFTLSVNYINNKIVFERQEKAQIERANQYADEQEKDLERELKHKWEDYRRDSLSYEKAWPESLSDAAGRRSATGRGTNLAAEVHDTTTINSFFRDKIIGERKTILRHEEEKRAMIARTRKTGVIQ